VTKEKKVEIEERSMANKTKQKGKGKEKVQRWFSSCWELLGDVTAAPVCG